MLKHQHMSTLGGYTLHGSCCQLIMDSSIPSVVHSLLGWKVLGLGKDNWYETGMPHLGSRSIWILQLSPSSSGPKDQCFCKNVEKINVFMMDRWWWGGWNHLLVWWWFHWSVWLVLMYHPSWHFVAVEVFGPNLSFDKMTREWKIENFFNFVIHKSWFPLILKFIKTPESWWWLWHEI